MGHNRWGRASGTSAMIGITLLFAVAAPARAALSNVSLVASNNQAGATGVSYTFAFQVGAAATAFAVVLPRAVDQMVAANVTVETSADGRTFAAAPLAALDGLLTSADGHRLGINLASAVAVGDWAKISVEGLRNPTTAGDVTLTVGGSLLPLAKKDLDATLERLLGMLAESADTTIRIVDEVTNGITNDVRVAPALTFTLGAAGHSWNLDPSGTASSNSVSDTITTATNARSYVIQAFVSGPLVRVGTDGRSAKDVIPHDAPASGPHFGYRVSGPSGDAVDSTAYRTFSRSATSLAPGWSLSGLTNGERTTVTYDVATDYTRAPGAYANTVTYRIVPTY